MKETGDPGRGNMQRSKLKCVSSFSATKQGPVQNSIELPILQNCRSLHEGEELLLYNESKREKCVGIEPKRKDPASSAKAKPAKARKS